MRSAVALLLLVPSVLAAPATTNVAFKLDQFGYRPGDAKVVVISDPQQGFNAADAYTAGPMLEIRRWSDDAPVLTGAPVAWRGGATHAQSGDRAWRFDFSAVTAPGSYYVHDPSTGESSGRFEIRDDVYAEVMKQAMRSFYYQRCGVAKPAAQAGASWADGACHLTGAEQDLDARYVHDTRPATSRDLSGGWHDAGDYNKYINYADNTVHDLLAAYEDHPAAFADDYGIPESGNGRPDILDELQVELEWMLKMQLPDGSVIHKLQATDFSANSPPSVDTTQRRYSPATPSATISACATYAHAAIVFGGQADATSQALATRLRAAAELAWGWLQANPGRVGEIYDNVGYQGAASEDDAEWQLTNMTTAAVYLACLTGQASYRAHVDANYDASHLIQWGFAYPFESEQQDGLLYYARCAQATPSVVAAIQAAYLDSVGGNDNWAPIAADDDAYLAFLENGNYTWGSSRTKANKGLMFLQLVQHGLAPARDAELTRAGADYLHHLHGVNANGLVFLSAMEPFGAERSCHEFYHSWFGDGTPWDNSVTSQFGPPPGFVPGGVNPQFQPDPSYAGPPLVPPLNQPVQKAYRDWNTSWPENSWEVTENAIGYQAGYVRLLSHFVTLPAAQPLQVSDPTDAALCVGDAVDLAVTATGGQPPLTYQWRQDGIDIPGSVADTHRVDATSLLDAGDYDCVVSDATPSSVTSGVATITVADVPATVGDTLRARKIGRGVELSWIDVAGATAHAAFRCDASLARPCAPVEFASAPSSPLVDANPIEPMVWYEVRARNTCGDGP